ncbi:MAG: family 10 glycosylhydrolase [Chloroflexi bacterium]|nr:family 10 glycosylhydrolase [Chloroflexota bacterium]
MTGHTRRSMAVAISLALFAALSGALTPGARTDAADEQDFRAYWVDAFGEGIFTPAEIDELVADATAGNFNAVVVQVGRRGDCFCNNAIMPRTQANIAPLPYDPLQTLLDKAHAAGIEVHAWIIATAIWNSGVAPLAPNHVYNTHGPSKTGYDNWVMTRYDGSRPGDTYLDPGHPAAADYIVSMYTSVVENYDVDGINFDRIRYPDGQLPAWPEDNSWGYNPVALARFHAATGRSDTPLPNDPEWSQWRREQITNIVRRVYLESYALKPQVVISADAITYGDGPEQLGGWERSRPYRETLQDWRAWMEEGILDLNIPMNYKREFCTGGPIPGCFGGFSQQAWYEHWNDYAKDHAYRRHVAIGSAVYLNSISDSVIQARKALAPSTAGNPSYGWVAYSYRTPDSLTNTGQRSGDASRAELTRALTQPSEYDPVMPPVFAEPAAVPPIGWKVAPTTGHILGSVRAAGGVPFDQVRVDLYDAETDALVGTRLTDGSGWFGFVDLEPGRYKAIVDGERAHGRRVSVVTVTAGQVTETAIAPKPR